MSHPTAASAATKENPSRRCPTGAAELRAGEGRISRRGAEHAEKAKTGEGEKPLRSMKSSQADKISNVCRATKGKSRRSNLVPLSFSACSAPLREILFVFAGGLTKRRSPCREKPGPHEPSYPFAPGAMPTARLSSTLRLGSTELPSGLTSASSVEPSLRVEDSRAEPQGRRQSSRGRRAGLVPPYGRLGGHQRKPFTALGATRRRLPREFTRLRLSQNVRPLLQPWIFVRVVPTGARSLPGRSTREARGRCRCGRFFWSVLRRGPRIPARRVRGRGLCPSGIRV